MVNALFSSKTGGSKQFQRADKPMFGWKAIDDLYERELERAKQNLTRMVPRLKETHCLRDAWTKLNVHPAKIMQVRCSLIFINLLFICTIMVARTSFRRASLVC